MNRPSGSFSTRQKALDLPTTGSPIYTGSMGFEEPDMAYAAATPTATSTDVKSADLPQAEFDLAVEGMTCASCVGRVEKALKRVPGVTDAAVNLATERAHVTGHGIDAEALVAAVDRTGFHASPIVEDQSPAAGTAAADEAAARQRRGTGPGLYAAAPSLPPVGRASGEFGRAP